LFDILPADQIKPAILLCVLLRIAVNLQRNRTHPELPEIKLETGKLRLALTFPEGWFEQHALTAADLEQEMEYLEDIGFVLSLSEPLSINPGTPDQVP